MNRKASPRGGTDRCPCGSGQPLAGCCGRYIGDGGAPTAEALMRSRYTAYALGKEEYLLRSWHASTRPARVDTGAGPQWMGLEIRSIDGGGPADERGTVEFAARFLEGDRVGVLQETSRFVREAGHWYYLDGTIHTAPTTVPVGRNEVCPCGSGRKFKRCHGG